MDIKQKLNYDLVKTSRYAIRILDTIKLNDKSVIVFDIDSTLIDSDNNVIQPIFTIYQYARMLNIKIVIITSRAGTPYVVDFTKKQLKDCGIIDIMLYYFRSPYKYNSWEFKRNARLNVHEKGYDIVMSIGDQDWDISGDYTGYGIKVPTNNIYDDYYAFSSPSQTVEYQCSSMKEEFPYEASSFCLTSPCQNLPCLIPYHSQCHYQTPIQTPTPTSFHDQSNLLNPNPHH